MIIEYIEQKKCYIKRSKHKKTDLSNGTDLYWITFLSQ